MISPQKQPESLSPESRSLSPNEENLNEFSLRALFSTENIYIISENTRNVFIETLDTQEGIAEISIGITERQFVTVSGSVEGVAKAYSLIVGCLVSSSPSYSIASSPPPPPSIQLLIPHSLMGSIVGRNGLKIKTIQEASGAHIALMKELPFPSAEQIVQVQGTPNAIRATIEAIGGCLLKDWEHGLNTKTIQEASGAHIALWKELPFQSAEQIVEVQGTPDAIRATIEDIDGYLLKDWEHGLNTNTIQEASGAHIALWKELPFQSAEQMVKVQGTPDAIRATIEDIGTCLLKDWEHDQDTPSFTPSASTEPPASPARTQKSEQRATQNNTGRQRTKRSRRTGLPAVASSSSLPKAGTQSISIPPNMIGRIMGPSGSIIQDIRQQSGTRISMATKPQENGEHKLTIVGTPAGNEIALRLISQLLEKGSSRRKKKEPSK